MVSPEGDRVRVVYKYEGLVEMCFQYGRVGHDANRCPHLYVGNLESRPYGEWLHAGSKMALSRPRSTEDSPPRHSPKPAPPTLPRDPRVIETPRFTKTPRLTLVDVTGNTDSRGAVNTTPAKVKKSGTKELTEKGFHHKPRKRRP